MSDLPPQYGMDRQFQVYMEGMQGCWYCRLAVFQSSKVEQDGHTSKDNEGKSMDLVPEVRLSDSPFVERVWRAHSEEGGAFLSMADVHSGIVITHHQGKSIITVRGPETVATPAYCPPGCIDFLGIMFKAGTFMPDLPATKLRDRNDITLPEATFESFWLNSATWQLPSFDNADTFVEWLVHDGIVVHESIVDDVLHATPTDITPRTIQRRFSQATGLTQTALRQIERARYATILLKQGTAFHDTVVKAGYFDQAHMIRSLKHFIGLTPGQIIDANRSEPLSFLYNTPPLLVDYHFS